MSLDTADLLFKDLVVETSLELSLAGRGLGNVHGILTTSEDDVVFLRSDGSAVQRSIGHVGLHYLEISCVDELFESAVFHASAASASPGHITLAVLSLDAVRQYVRSGDHWISVIRTSSGAPISWICWLSSNSPLYKLSVAHPREGARTVPDLAIILRNGAVLVTSNDVLGHVAPACSRWLALGAIDLQHYLVRLLGIHVHLDVEDQNGSQESLTLLGDGQ